MRSHYRQSWPDLCREIAKLWEPTLPEPITEIAIHEQPDYRHRLTLTLSGKSGVLVRHHVDIEDREELLVTIRRSLSEGRPA